jgi:hypothetical protein
MSFVPCGSAAVSVCPVGASLCDAINRERRPVGASLCDAINRERRPVGASLCDAINRERRPAALPQQTCCSAPPAIDIQPAL